MTDLLPFGPGAWAFIGLYLLSTLLVGWAGYRARRENSLGDFYLGGRGFGTAVLLLTLFATQYSGNTFFGFTGSAYRLGYVWVMSLHFMTAIVVFYLLLAPPLYARARARGYVTPPDFLQDRFGARALTVVAALIMVVALANYVLAQLMAMGRALEGLAQAHPDEAYRYGVIGLAIIMVLYGTLGGMRAVAWTDAIQGAMILAGITVVFVLMFQRFGSPAEAGRLLLAAHDPAVAARARPPSAEQLRTWVSYVLLFGLGASLYPQAIQRIYAARSARILRRSLACMAFLPLPTTLMALTVGIVALAHLPGLSGPDADRVFTLVLREIQQVSTLGYALVVLLIAAVLAAMMSTADSALLSISSILSNDLYRPLLRPHASQAELTRVGKLCSWALIVVLIALALALREQTSLIDLLDRKFDLLVQLAPAFFLGLRWSGLRAGPVLAGLLAGVGVALALAFVPLPFVTGGKIAGLHPGLYGLALNLLVAVGGSVRRGAVASA